MEDKYLIINADDITRLKYQTLKEAYCNYFDNINYKTGEETLAEIFNLYQIPKEYQKIAFRINNSISLKSLLIAKELWTETIFDININPVENNSFGSTINRNIDKYVSFNSSNYKLITSTEMANFIKELKKKNILTKYIEAIDSFYRIKTNKKIEMNNINKLNLIMNKYKNGEYGNHNLTFHEILEKADSLDLIDKFTSEEIDYLLLTSTGITKLLYLNIKKTRNTKLNNLIKVKKYN